MVVGHINGVVGLTGFSDRRMCELLLGPYKSGRNKGVVVLTGWSYGGVPLYTSSGHSKVLNVQNVGYFIVISSCLEKRCSLMYGLENWYTLRFFK